MTDFAAVCFKFATPRLPVDEFAALLRLLQKVHELALSISQVDIGGVLTTVAERLLIVSRQTLVGVHDLETHCLLLSIFSTLVGYSCL